VPTGDGERDKELNFEAAVFVWALLGPFSFGLVFSLVGSTLAYIVHFNDRLLPPNTDLPSSQPCLWAYRQDH
jgi:hypothetical protein